MAQGKCNLLKPVDCTTGTFFMFSQVAQDLTCEFTQADAYRVVPSKFAALKLDLTYLNSLTKDDSLTEKTLGQVFQNYFENACTHIRATKGDDWNPEVSLPILWNTLSKYGLIDLKQSENNYVSDAVKYIGDINIYSYNPTSDGIGYSEIYCYIPEDAKSTEYPMQYVPNPEPYALGDDVKNIHGYEGDKTATYTGLHWMLDDPNIPLQYYDIPKGYSTRGCIPDVLNYLDPSIDDRSRTIQNVRMNGDDIVESFDFNAILVMYDVVSKANDIENDRVVYHNIPLGIYFTGKPANGELTNTVVKFVKNEDIYNQGTAYGLRICSRFLCSPNLTKFESVETSSGDYDAIFTEALSKMAENCDYFKDVTKEINTLSHELTTHLANFRNNKVNVPYLRNLNGTYYWFVNGRNTGVPANSITREEVDEMMRKMDRIENTLEETIRETIEQMSVGFEPMTSRTIDNAVEQFRNILERKNG